MLKPLFDNVVLKREKQELKTASGIVLQESSKNEPSIGEIVAVGPGKMIDGQVATPSVREGQRVVFKRYGGTEVEIDHVEYLIVSEEDILAILD